MKQLLLNAKCLIAPVLSALCLATLTANAQTQRAAQVAEDLDLGVETLRSQITAQLEEQQTSARVEELLGQLELLAQLYNERELQLELLRAQNAQLDARLDQAGLDNSQLRSENQDLLNALELGEEKNAALEASFANDRLNLEQESDAQLEAARLAFEQELAVVRADFDDDVRAYASQETELLDQLALAQGTGADQVEIRLSGGQDAPLTLTQLSWTLFQILPDGSLGEALEQGSDTALELPSAAGLYRLAGSLGGQSFEANITVSPYKVQQHLVELEFGRAVLALEDPADASSLLEIRDDQDDLVFSAQQLEASTQLYLPGGSYNVSLISGQSRQSWTLEIAVGQEQSLLLESANHRVEIALTTPDNLSADQLSWTFQPLDGQNTNASGKGGVAAAFLAPGDYQLGFGIDAIVQTHPLSVDENGEFGDETLAFDRGAVRLEPSNMSQAMPAAIPLSWQLTNDQDEVVFASRDPRTVRTQLSAGTYRASIQAGDQELVRPLVISAGQTALLAPDFSLGLLSASLIDSDTGEPIQARWVLTSPDQEPVELANQVPTVEAYVKSGTYRLSALTDQGRVERPMVVHAGQVSVLELLLQ